MGTSKGGKKDRDTTEIYMILHDIAGKEMTCPACPCLGKIDANGWFGSFMQMNESNRSSGLNGPGMQWKGWGCGWRCTINLTQTNDKWVSHACHGCFSSPKSLPCQIFRQLTSFGPMPHFCKLLRNRDSKRT